MSASTFATSFQVHRSLGRRLFEAIAEVGALLRRESADEQTVIALSRHEPRLLRDMGFDPDAIYDAVEGTWDQVPEARRGR